MKSWNYLARRAGIAALAFSTAVPAAEAMTPTTRHHAHAVRRSPAVPKPSLALPPSAYIVMDAASGDVLDAQAPDAPRHPASMTKIMTLMMVFDALKAGRLGIDEPIPVSAAAARIKDCSIGLKAGATIAVRDAIPALTVESSNEIAKAFAERLAGSEEAFAAEMTQSARARGAKDTTFVNASGMPDERQITTARDFATLSRALIAGYHEYYSYFSQRHFALGPHKSWNNHNHLLEGYGKGKKRVAPYPGLDGIKTGFVNASGYNASESAENNGQRLIVVVFGGRTARDRDLLTTQLFNRNFAKPVPGSPPAPPLQLASTPKHS